MDEDEQLERFDSEFASTSSISSTLSTDDFRNLTSSGDISSISSGSGEIPPVSVLAPPFLHCEGSNDGETAAAREKCVGRSNKGVSWGHTSVIGRRKEMEDAVAVIPGFMSRTCDHIGGCTAPGSRSSGEIAPVHFFGVYDGHGGSQVSCTFLFFFFRFFNNNYVTFVKFWFSFLYILKFERGVACYGDWTQKGRECGVLINICCE